MERDNVRESGCKTGIVVTGVGLVTPLGTAPDAVLEAVTRGRTAAVAPAFDTGRFDCPLCAPVQAFDAEALFGDNKSVRLMSRAGQFAVAAARKAMDDAAVVADVTYPADRIALYGATGVAGMPLEDIAPILRVAGGADGTMDLDRFGHVALRRVRPVLSFKILANMPLCFVSIFENVKGPNAVYTPWEGHGAHALGAGIRAIRRGDASCALVGGCDVKTEELAFINLQQLGVFESWRRSGKGCIPGEGAAFLVLEDEAQAARRGRVAYARISRYRLASGTGPDHQTLACVLAGLGLDRTVAAVAASDGDTWISDAETQAWDRTGLHPTAMLMPKACLGNLFAAAAPVQVCLAATWVRGPLQGLPVVADCFGHGTEQAAFVLEAA